KQLDRLLNEEIKSHSTHLEVREEPEQQRERSMDVAIIGMSLRVPGAASPEAFWENLVNGVESITRLTPEQLASSGFDPEELSRNSRFVPAKGLLEGSCDFDAKFFGMLPKEAKHTDPQHRV